MNKRLYSTLNRLETKKANKSNYIPGLLGFMLGGVKTVEVPDRPGYVYVRLRSNTNELVMAFNDVVSPVYDLPVLLVRDEIDKSRYKIQGRDIGKYENWGSVSAYLPRHGNQHAFNPDGGGGGDIVWVYDRQLMPLAVTPSGSAGSRHVTVAHDTIFQRNTWRSVGGTGTADLVTYKPTGSTAVLLLVYLDGNGNPQISLGAHFSESVTGTSAIVPYIPSPPNTYDIPLGAVRLVSGTSVIGWDNIYDLRAILRDATTTGTVVSNKHIIQDDGVDQTARDYLNFVGSGFVVYDNGTATVISGTASSSPGASVPTYPAVYDDSTFKATGTAFSFGNNLSVAVTGTTVFIDATAGGGGAGGYPAIHDDSVYKATGSILSFNSNLSVVATGTSVFINATDTSIPTYPAILDDSVFKATGTQISFNNNLSVVTTGTSVFINATDTSIPTYPAVYDDSTFKATGTAISFGNNLSVAVTGTTVFVDATAGGGGGGYPVIYDDKVYRATGSAISFDHNLDVVATGSSAFVKLADNVSVSGTLQVVSTALFKTNVSISGTLNMVDSGAVFWDSSGVLPLQRAGSISVFVSNEEPPTSYYYRSDAYGDGNIQQLFRVYSGTSAVGNTLISQITQAFDVDAGPYLAYSQGNPTSDFHVAPSYFQIGQAGRIAKGLIVGSPQTEASSIVPPTGTLMMRQVGTPPASYPGYNTLYIDNGIPKVINPSGSVFVPINGVHIFDDTTFKTTGTTLVFGSGLSVVATGSSVFIDSLASTGSGGIIIQGSGDHWVYPTSADWVGVSGSPLTSTNWDGDLYPTTSKTKIDLSTEFGVPANVKAVLARLAVRDLGAATVESIVYLSHNSTDNFGAAVDSYPVSNRWHRSLRIVPCDGNGDIYYQTVSSASGTAVSLQIWGYSLDLGAGGFPAVFDDSVFKATGTNISFDSPLNVVATGTSVFVGMDSAYSQGWIPATHTWTYLSGSMFTIAGNYTGTYYKGTKLKWTQTTQKYGVVKTVNYVASNTQVSIFVNDDYVVSNAAITSPHYSFMDNPAYFPEKFNFTSVWSSVSNPQPVLGSGTLYSTYIVRGGSIRCNIQLVWGTGTSGGTGIWMFSLPASSHANPDISYWGNLYLFDISTGNRYHRLAGLGRNQVVARYSFDSNALSTSYQMDTTTPFTWAIGDIYSWDIEYPFS